MASRLAGVREEGRENLGVAVIASVTATFEKGEKRGWSEIGNERSVGGIKNAIAKLPDWRRRRSGALLTYPCSRIKWLSNLHSRLPRTGPNIGRLLGTHWGPTGRCLERLSWDLDVTNYLRYYQHAIDHERGNLLARLPPKVLAATVWLASNCTFEKTWDLAAAVSANHPVQTRGSNTWA
jgi:hypothetical protein